MSDRLESGASHALLSAVARLTAGILVFAAIVAGSGLLFRGLVNDFAGQLATVTTAVVLAFAFVVWIVVGTVRSAAS